MRRPLLIAAALVAAAASPALGQASGHSPGDWKRVETEHFLFLYPEDLAGWVLPMARRMESVRESVQALVGFAPEERVTVLVDDPRNVSNGSMNPGPLLFLWPTPPDPRSLVGANRGWSEILAVHELAHAAHLTRPTRNPLERLRWALMPIPVTRLMTVVPRWATEGYATYIEGRLTGSGRPHGVWRPAVLRTWALEGQLPTYGQLSSSDGFYGGVMAYLVGSAFLEWLVAREDGDETVLPDVWARLTAREVRSFDAAFTGVFGAPPSELYGLFKVDVTERALAVRDAVEAAGGVVDGELFQRLSWTTGDPAVSPDGERLAVVLRGRDQPSRVVIMSTTPDTVPTRVRERQAEILEDDPQDVAAVQRRPRAQRAEATLWPTAGAPYDSPVWMPDGEGILVVRSGFIENERIRDDLFLWEWESGDLRRITHGAGIREAWPSPDGSWAAGLRCLNARCDIVRVELDDGTVTMLAQGDPLSPWFRPRISPDGSTIVASRQVEGRWRLAAMDADGTDIRFIGPADGASRFEATFMPGGDRLVLTSTRGGIHDLEILNLDTGEVRPLTRVVGAAVAPAATPDGRVFFLSLHSRGWDLRRIRVDSAAASDVVVNPALTPAAAAGPATADTFDVAPIGPIRPYGLGPRTYTVAPIGLAAAGRYSAGLALSSTDPIGMLSWQLRGLYGGDEAPRGGALDIVWRGLPAEIRGGAFAVAGFVPSAGVPADPAPDGLIEEAYYGGLATVAATRVRTGVTRTLALGGSAGILPGEANRLLGWGTARSSRLRTLGTWRFSRSVALHGALGRTGELRWTRWLVAGAVQVGGQARALGLSGRFGRTDAPVGSPEAFTIGGFDPVLLDPGLLSQRLAMPALPAGFLAGDQVWTARADLGGDPLRLFYWLGDARGDTVDPYQVLGAEIDALTPAVHYLRIPAMQLRVGLARLLDDPLQNQWRAWALLAIRP